MARRTEVTWAQCLAAAATMLSQSSKLTAKWSESNWATFMSNEVRQLADRIYEDAQA